MKEIRENAGGGAWMHAERLGAISDTSARTSALMGNCRFPLYITSKMAGLSWFRVKRAASRNHLLPASALLYNVIAIALAVGILGHAPFPLIRIWMCGRMDTIWRNVRMMMKYPWNFLEIA